MSNNLPVLSGGVLPSKLDRQLARAIAQVEASTALACRQDRARIDRMAGTADHGMVRVAQLGAKEAALIQGVPTAAPYVHAVAVAGAIGIAGIVYDAGMGS